MAVNYYKLMYISLLKLKSKEHIDRLRHSIFINRVYQQAYEAQYYSDFAINADSQVECNPQDSNTASDYLQDSSASELDESDKIDDTLSPEFSLEKDDLQENSKRGVDSESEADCEHKLKRVCQDTASNGFYSCENSENEKKERILGDIQVLNKDFEVGSVCNDPGSSLALCSAPDVDGYALSQSSNQKSPRDIGFSCLDAPSTLLAVCSP